MEDIFFIEYKDSKSLQLKLYSLKIHESSAKHFIVFTLNLNKYFILIKEIKYKENDAAIESR